MSNLSIRQEIRNQWSIKEELAAQEEAKWYSLGKMARASIAAKMKNEYHKLANTSREKVVE